MSTLTAEQIARARQAKKRYLLSLLLVVTSGLMNALVAVFKLSDSPVDTMVTWCQLAALVFAMITTWQLCRAIRIGVVATVLVTLVSPVAFIIEFIVLLRLYAKRTGLGLTFMMGDKEPRQSLAA